MTFGRKDLLAELKERREKLIICRDGEAENIVRMQAYVDGCNDEIGQLDRAILALIAPTDQGNRIIEAQPSAPLDQAAEQTTDELEGGKPEAGLQEFMQRPGAVRVEENMMIEGGVEDRHWLYESGYIFTGKDPILIWRSDNDHGTIVAYAPAEAPTPKPTETESETHVLDAEPSPVLRSDLSPSTETFTAPSGDEFAKHNGETRLIVSDALEAA